MTETPSIEEPAFLALTYNDDLTDDAERGTILLEAPTPIERQPPRLVVDMRSDSDELASILRRSMRVTHGKFQSRFKNVYLTWAHCFFIGSEFQCFFIGRGRAIAELLTSGWLHPIDQTMTGLQRDGANVVVSRAKLSAARVVEQRVMVATADEPSNWGLWLLNAVPAADLFVRNRDRFDLFMTFIFAPTQVQLLALMGIDESEVLRHQPIHTYLLRDATLLRRTMRDLYVSTSDMAVFQNLACKAVERTGPTGQPHIFISRRSRTTMLQGSRGLVNEAELADALAARGFIVVEPENLTAVEQISAFACAEVIVGLGGAGMFNTVFCRPGTKVLDLESTAKFCDAHSNIFASAKLDYAIVVGQEDLFDTAHVHRRWTVDIPCLLQAVDDLVGSGD